jgi:hypothetical protein
VDGVTLVSPRALPYKTWDDNKTRGMADVIKKAQHD